MSQRKFKTFQRLLARTEELTDPDCIKENMIVIDKLFNELRNSNIISSQESKEYLTRIKNMQSKIAPKVVAPKPKSSTVCITPNEIALAQEKHKQSILTDELLRETEKIKQNVIKVGLYTGIDAEVLDNVRDNLENVTNKSEKTNVQMTEVKSERVGWRAYLWLIYIVVVFLLVRFIFQ
ncbi:hypothetical protein GPJ56_006749 [Histomonas meleagridis]|uniref:uncharacterized protein n=1 Tax=Histomonas meleagridis TaxID=135588 RepID=UPI0035598F01|nr:hypothetical protein GPJ56_006749 [Histomonas meleagridis]KAH0806955.1 hypothetical protein GO595_000131 [Histomonas meleagridis]